MAVQHRNIPREHMHDPYRWVVADEAARLELSVNEVDVMKWAYQLSDGTIWELSEFDPVAWRQVADPAGAASKAVTEHEQEEDPHDQYVRKEAGKGLSDTNYSQEEKDKLSAIQSEATKNASDADLRDRSTHTGTQSADTIDDFQQQAAAAAPVQSVDGESGDVDLSGRYEAKRQNNLTAITNPTPTDDSTVGYEPLSRWINTTTGEIWLCVDATAGAANWQQATLTLDELGSAAVADVGTGANQVPRNSDLGSAAYVDASEFDDAGAAAAAVSSHETEIDPHPQYMTEQEAAAAAPVQSVDGQTGDVDLSGNYEAKRQNNLTATTDPGPGDDAAAGYEPLSRWINTTTGEIWLCVDATAGAANWQQATLTLDELGSAALADVGTGQTQIPLNSDLGSAAYSDASEFDDAGAAAAAVSSHEAEIDPHPQYTTEDEVNDLAPRAPGILDGLRRSVEAASGGRMTVFYTALGQPSYFVRQPQFLCEDIAPGGELGTGVHEAFKFGAETDAEIWVGAYPGSVINGEGVSQPGAVTGRSITFDAARAACQAAGAGYDLMTTWDWAAVALWCMANGFEPRGNTNHGRHHDNRWETGARQDGDIYLPGDSSGVGNILTGSGPAQWRHDGTMSGISDLVGNVWEWCLGFKMVDGRIFLSPDNAIPAESSYTDTGWDMPGGGANPWSSLNNTGASDVLKRALIVPRGADDPIGRLYVNNTGERLPIRGGNRHAAGGAGLGALYLHGARTNSSTNIGFRPRFRNP